MKCFMCDHAPVFFCFVLMFFLLFLILSVLWCSFTLVQFYVFTQNFPKDKRWELASIHRWGCMSCKAEENVKHVLVGYLRVNQAQRLADTFCQRAADVTAGRGIRQQVIRGLQPPAIVLLQTWHQQPMRSTAVLTSVYSFRCMHYFVGPRFRLETTRVTSAELNPKIIAFIASLVTYRNARFSKRQRGKTMQRKTKIFGTKRESSTLFGMQSFSNNNKCEINHITFTFSCTLSQFAISFSGGGSELQNRLMICDFRRRSSGIWVTPAPLSWPLF